MIVTIKTLYKSGLLLDLNDAQDKGLPEGHHSGVSRLLHNENWDIEGPRFSTHNDIGKQSD